ncbi:hypothetical protein THAOC_28792, partial [Thalassiosira oceanica]
RSTMPNSTDQPEPEIPILSVRDSCPSESTPNDGANETSQRPWKVPAPLVSQSQDDGRPDADYQGSNAHRSQLSPADASTSLGAADAAPRKHDSGRLKKMKRGPKTGQPCSNAASTEPSQQLQKERVPLVSQSQGDGRPDADDQDSSSAGAATSLVAVDTAQKKRGSGRRKKKKRGPKTGKPGSTAASQDTQSGSSGTIRPNSQGTASGKSKRGRGRPPSRDGTLELKDPVPKRRQLPNRGIKTKEKIGSIRDTAANPSRSEGRQSTDVSDSRSRYSSSYLSTKSAEGTGVEGTASQHESVVCAALPEQEKTKSVSFSSNNNGPPASAGNPRQSSTRWPRLSGGRVSEVVSIPLEYGDGYDLNGALYSGRVENDKPNGRGKLRFEGVVLYGCHGGKKYDVIINRLGMAGEPDGRGKMHSNADKFQGTFYPSLSDEPYSSSGEMYLIPFVGTRTLADGSTQDGAFILARGLCYKITDVCFESGFIILSRFCLKVSRQADSETFEYTTKTPVDGPNRDDFMLSLVKSIAEVFKGNANGVPEEWRDTFEILECERLQRLRKLSAASSHDGCVHLDSFDVFSIAKSGIDYYTTLLRVYDYLRKKSDELNSSGIINIEDDIKAFREDYEDTELSSRSCHIVTNMEFGIGLGWYSGATEGGRPCGFGVHIKYYWSRLSSSSWSARRQIEFLVELKTSHT